MISRLTGLSLAVTLLTTPTLHAHENEGQFAPFKLIIDAVSIESPEDFKRTIARLIEETPKAGFITDERMLTGFAGMFNPAPESYQSSIGSEKCAQARLEKEEWHMKNLNGTLPPAFGKMTNFSVYELDEGYNLWAGSVETCSWILPYADVTIDPQSYNKDSYIEYYFHIAFPMSHASGYLEEHKKVDGNIPFPGTLDFSELEVLNPAGAAEILNDMKTKWGFKLHSNGNGMKFVEARRNGMQLSQNDPIFLDQENMCFDVFFVDEPKGYTLPSDQNAFCMGRCDARILNTP